MNKDELLEIYSAYLPYRLKFISIKNNQQYLLTGIDNINKWPLWASTEWNGKSHKYEPEINLKSGGTIGNGFKLKEVKPVLYPLEYLTKEIEHEGEKFVPQNKLRHLDLEWLINSDKLIMKTNYEDVLKLLEWHFNVFQLPEDQFINKATLTNK